MANLNKVFLIGNLTRDPELRYTPSGTAVVSFGMAMSRNFTTQSGEKKEEVCFVRVVVFGKQAEACNQYLTKGRPIFVEGRLQYRSWETEGQKRNTLDVVAERVQFLGRLKEGGETKLESFPIKEEVLDTTLEEEIKNAGSNKDSEEVPF